MKSATAEMLSAAKESKELLRGLVRELRRHVGMSEKGEEEGRPETEVVVRYSVNDEIIDVIVPESECVVFYRQYTLLSIVGEEVYFTITDVYAADDVVFGSIKEADKIRKAPTLKKLYDKKVLNGTFVKFVKGGAYIDVGNGVQGLLRNSDCFPKSGKFLCDEFKPFMEIKVIYHHTTEKGTIIFIPEAIPYQDECIQPFERGKIYQGRITKVFPDKVFVGMRANFDCLCGYPLALGMISPGDTVSVKVTKYENGKLRGKILNRISS